MSPPPDTRPHRPHRRRAIGAVLLAVVPLAVAATLLAGGGLLPQTADASLAEAQPVASADGPVGKLVTALEPGSAPASAAYAGDGQWNLTQNFQ